MPPNRYKPALGVPFDAFARRRVQGAMLDSLRELDWAPRSLRRLRREVDAAIASCATRSVASPAKQEIAEAMDLTSPTYEKAHRTAAHARDRRASGQLDALGRTATALLELCVDPARAPWRSSNARSCALHLARAIEELPERERQILALYYEEELTLAEIGEVIGVGESRVSQLRSLALARLRTLLRESLGCWSRGREQDSFAGRDRRAPASPAAAAERARRRSGTPAASSPTTSAGRIASRRSSSARCTSCTTVSRSTCRRRCRRSCAP